MKSTDPMSDEAFALELLQAHLTNLGESGCRCEINKNDPPDLVVTWERGEQWGVEVTRTYQQVQQIGKSGIVSSEEVGAPLRRFAEELEGKSEGMRRRDYTLCLEGPGPFNAWKRSVPLKQWKKNTEDLVLKHIESDVGDVLRFSGGVLRPGEQGKRWTVMVGNSATELTSARTTMLRRSLKDKTADLSKWKGKFAQRWLLLLNCYPHAGSTTELKSILHRLGGEHDNTHKFDGIFWSGYPDRTLVRMYLAKKP
jgi:hypothetical protein